MIKSKKKSSGKRSSFIFKDTQFFEDPCKETMVLYAMGGQGIGGVKGAPTVVMGPARIVRQIKSAMLRG